jgi:hypothetical protein
MTAVPPGDLKSTREKTNCDNCGNKKRPLKKCIKLMLLCIKKMNS